MRFALPQVIHFSSDKLEVASYLAMRCSSAAQMRLPESKADCITAEVHCIPAEVHCSPLMCLSD